MKKQLPGILLFFAIVTIAVSLTLIYRNTDISSLNVQVENSFNKSKLEVKQAVLNIKNGLFAVDVKSPNSDEKLLLTFFEKSEQGVKPIAVEEIIINKSKDRVKNTSFFKKFDWAKQLNAQSNVYLIVERENSNSSSKTVFEESKAIPVLIMRDTETSRNAILDNIVE